MSRYDSKAVRQQKAVRRELLRPLRAILEGSGYSVRIPPCYLDRVYIDGSTTRPLTVFLGEIPNYLPTGEWMMLDEALTEDIFNWMDDDLDRAQENLDDARLRIEEAAVRFEEVESSEA